MCILDWEHATYRTHTIYLRLSGQWVFWTGNMQLVIYYCRKMKHLIIGNMKNKTSLMQLGTVPRSAITSGGSVLAMVEHYEAVWLLWMNIMRQCGCYGGTLWGTVVAMVEHYEAVWWLCMNIMRQCGCYGGTLWGSMVAMVEHYEAVWLLWMNIMR